MQACLILLTLAVSTPNTQAVVKLPDLVFSAGSTVDQKFDALSEWLNLWKDSSEYDITGELVNVTNALLRKCNIFELLIDLEVLKRRQAVAGTIQGAQLLIFLTYLATSAVCYLVKCCRKQKRKQKQKQKQKQKKIDEAEFELLEIKLQASRSRRRAAVAARTSPLVARTSKQNPQ